MTIPTLLSLFLFLFSLIPSIQPKPLTSPYLSPKTLFPNYQKMLTTFKIYSYSPPPQTQTQTQTQLDSLFYKALLNTKFLTQDPNQAHLFFIPFSPDLSTRSIARVIKDLRITLPYWNRTLGADHVFFSRAGITSTSDRNVVELKKNSIQISNFPTTPGYFIPHKDITLPPRASPHAPVPVNKTVSLPSFLGYMKIGKTDTSTRFIDELNDDPDFFIESEPSDYIKSKFCLFMYDQDVSWIGEALGKGCVPVVITDRPIQDLPLMDVIRWSEIAVFSGTRGGVAGLKGLLSGINEDRYEEMRGLGVAASQHLVWSDSAQPLDAFHMVMYQLWLRRHTIRYARRVWDE